MLLGLGLDGAVGGKAIVLQHHKHHLPPLRQLRHGGVEPTLRLVEFRLGHRGRAIALHQPLAVIHRVAHRPHLGAAGPAIEAAVTGLPLTRR